MFKKIINAAKDYNVEVLLSKGSIDKLSFEEDDLKDNSSGAFVNLSICVVKDNKLGFANTNNLEKWKECLENAKKISNVSKPLKEYFGLPGKQKYMDIPYDKGIESLDIQKMVEKIKISMTIATDYDKRIRLPGAHISRGISESSFANSNGIVVERKGSVLDAAIFASAGGVNGSEFFISRKDDLDFGLLGRTASKLCIDAIDSKKVETKKQDVILDYHALSAVIWVISNALGADNVQKKKSFYYDKLGKEIMDPSITIIDDHTLKAGLETGKADAEGISAKKTILVENGVLKNFMYDFLTAKKEGKETTGNCANFATKPCIDPTNFIIKPGNYSKEELISSSNLIITEIAGSHTINPISGDFSLGIQNGFSIEKDKFYGIKHGMIAGNVFEVFKKVEIGKNMRQDSSLVAPWIKLKNVQVIG